MKNTDQGCPNGDMFSQLAGHKFSSFGGAGPAVTCTFSGSATWGDVTLISKSDVTCYAPEKMTHEAPCNHIADCDTLSAMGLRQRYRAEATCHRNMLNREQKKGAVIHRDFRDFRSFLRLMGPKPANQATVDRINNDDPEYAPGKVRWADKRTQNSNKGDSLVFHDQSTGKTYSTSQLAKMHGVPANTIRQRRNRSWSDQEIIRGLRDKRVHASSDNVTPLRKSKDAVPQAIAPANHAESWAQREFNATAEGYRVQREEDGSEAFIPEYEEMLELRKECGMDYTIKDYEANFKNKWPGHRSHVDFDNIRSQAQRELIARIDPEFVASSKSKRKLEEVMKSAL